MALTRKEKLLKAMLEDNLPACGGGVTREERMLAGVAKKTCENDALDGGGSGGGLLVREYPYTELTEEDFAEPTIVDSRGNKLYLILPMTETFNRYEENIEATVYHTPFEGKIYNGNDIRFFTEDYVGEDEMDFYVYDLYLLLDDYVAILNWESVVDSKKFSGTYGLYYRYTKEQQEVDAASGTMTRVYSAEAKVYELINEMHIPDTIARVADVGDFCVNVTASSDGDSATSDKTFSEINAALESGQNVQFMLKFHSTNGNIYYYQSGNVATSAVSSTDTHYIGATFFVAPLLNEGVSFYTITIDEENNVVYRSYGMIGVMEGS